MARQHSPAGTDSPAAFLVRIVVVGSGGVGKSSLTLQFMYNDFVVEYEPTKADSYRKDLSIDGDHISLDIMDTAGQEEYVNVRDNYLRAGDGFLCVFSLTERDSFRATRDLREQILRVKSNQPDIPMILIGNKTDLTAQRQVSEEEALALALDWNCKYMETSAKTRLNVENAFYDIARHVMKVKKSGDRSGKKRTPAPQRPSRACGCLPCFR
jgi:small GTP-binding protein